MMLKQAKNMEREYCITIHFEESGEADNEKALLLLYCMMKFADIIHYYPTDLVSDKECARIIKEEGFRIQFKTRYEPYELRAFFSKKCSFDIDVGI
ncbi:P2 response regulator binding domain-containing protein [Desulfosporosinus lacus DSM 15449]|uniref:p2 response regulator binding domain-containing protein n=2 Tax=Desulfosporosinus TaxID=79206 RepID=A0A1M5ZUB9_9FIRM|nr:P2 response regulator binding domain-containing protein [Desulfosporosinus lacus DSM 15449]